MSLPDPAVLITAIADELKAHLQAHNIDNPRFVGIHTGGVWVANALLKELKSEEPLGILTCRFIATISAVAVCIHKYVHRSYPLILKISTWY